MARRIDLPTLVFRVSIWTLAMLTLVLLIAPTLVVLIVSFTDGFSLKFPPPGYSLKWYGELIDASQLHFAAWNSIKVAVATTVLSVLGVCGALAITLADTVARVLGCSCLRWCCRRWPGFAALMTFW
jgi:putative spermidine/putrescine transport system permease protein